MQHIAELVLNLKLHEGNTISRSFNFLSLSRLKCPVYTWVLLGGERHCKVSCPRVQHNVPCQSFNPDCFFWGRAHQPWDHLLTHWYKWIPANCWGQPNKLLKSDLLWTSILPEGVDTLLATSCYRNQDQLWQLWASRLQGFALLLQWKQMAGINNIVNETC